MLFADDSNMFITGKNILELAKSMNQELQNVSQCLKTNKLSLNIPKTRYMVFSKIRKKVNLDMKIEGNTINQVHSTKFLGIIIDDDLSWKSHVRQVSTKVAKGMGIIIKAKPYINKTTLMDLYHAFFFPYITYCNLVLGSTFNTHLNQLSILQKQIVRILSNKAYNDHTSELFKRLKILKEKHINRFQIALHMYKHDNNGLPTCLDGMFQTNSTHHNYNTRNRNQLRTSKYRLVKTEHSIRFLGQQI